MMTQQSIQDPSSEGKSEMVTILCQTCQMAGTGDQYSSIDLTVHPLWKEELLNGELFHWSCPNCGSAIDLCYPSRYLDGEGKLGIVLRPGADTSGGNGDIELMNQRLEGMSMLGYLHRVCGNFFAMQELVRVRDGALDDRVIQLLKPFIIGQLQSIDLEVWNGFFVSVQNPVTKDTPLDDVIYMIENDDQEAAYGEPVYWYDIHLTDGKVMHRGINHTVYRLCMGLLEERGYGEDDGRFYLYDLSWAIGFHNERE